MRSQFTLPKTFLHSTETNPHSTCLSTHATATKNLVPADRMTWCFIMIIPCSTVRLSVQLSLLLHPFRVSQESPWAAPSDQHSHAGEVSMSPRHSDYAANMVLVCSTMQKPESLTCYTGLSHLCGGPAAGCCLPDVMSCWLASRQEIMHRGIFNMCRSTWPQLLLRSGLSWIRKLDWLYFHERQCHHFCML